MKDYELHKIVYDDALAARNEVAMDDAQSRRRAYVRAAFAAIEALTYSLKQSALATARREPGLFSPGEIALLSDESYGLSHSGKVVASPKYLSTPDNFRFAVDMAMKATLKGFSLHVGVSGWEALKKATKLRNRLVHPKSAAEMHVTDEEMGAVDEAFFWVNDATIKSLSQAVAVLYRETGTPPAPEFLAIQERWKVMREKSEKGSP